MDAIALVRKFVGLDVRAVSIGAGLSARLAMPRCQDKLLDLYIDESEALEDRTPYYGVLWPSAIGLSQSVSSFVEEGDSVLELGCGLGLGGIATALAARPSRVLVTDYDPAAVYLARLSAKLSGVSRSVLRAAPVDWNEREQWASHGLRRDAFDVAIAADIIYEAAACKPVADILAHALRPGGRFLLADGESRLHRAQLRDALLERGRFVALEGSARVLDIEESKGLSSSQRGTKGADLKIEAGRVVLQCYERTSAAA